MRFTSFKLLGRIREYGLTQADLAASIGINKGTLNAKLNGQSYFTAQEIGAICEVLHISYQDIPVYFFNTRVQKK